MKSQKFAYEILANSTLIDLERQEEAIHRQLGSRPGTWADVQRTSPTLEGGWSPKGKKEI